MQTIIWRRRLERSGRNALLVKNECQHIQNLVKAGRAGAGTDARKRDIDQMLAMTRTSTAKFDRVLDCEKELRGVKRMASVCAFLLPHAHSLLFAPVRSD